MLQEDHCDHAPPISEPCRSRTRIARAAAARICPELARGGPEALTEVVTGRVDFMCIGVSSGLAFIREGKLLPLAVSTPKRSSALPNVPTTLEAGLSDADYIFWMGMFVPAKTPREIINRLHQETQKALRNPQVVEKFAPQGIEPMPLAPAEFDALIKKEIASNTTLVKAAGLKFN